MSIHRGGRRIINQRLTSPEMIAAEQNLDEIQALKRKAVSKGGEEITWDEVRKLVEANLVFIPGKPTSSSTERYQCRFCAYTGFHIHSFRYASRLINHHKSHFNFQNFACMDCGRRFSRAKALKNHMTTAHPRNRPPTTKPRSAR